MAISVNKVTLVGRLGADPELKGQQRDVVTFRVATSESWRDKNTGDRQERTQWHSCVCFSEPVGRFLAQYARKGDLIYVEGTLETRKWERGPNDFVYYTEVIIRPYSGGVQLMSKDSVSVDRSDEREERREPRREERREERPRQTVQQRRNELDDEIPF